MGHLTFYRYRDAEEPCIELVEPEAPSKRIQGKLRRLGFSQDEDEAWCQTLSALGRRNMGCSALEQLLSDAGLDGVVVDAPSTPGDVTEEVSDGDEHDEHEEPDWQTPMKNLARNMVQMTGRIDQRAYELARKVDRLQAANEMLAAMLMRLSSDPGDAGRRILVQENEPQHQFDGRAVYFDRVRQVPLTITPEEHVRQRTLRHLEEHLGVPRQFLLSEFRIPRRADRADVVVQVSREGEKPRFLAVLECKAEGVPLNDDVWRQVQRYGKALAARYVGITDGQALLAREWNVKDGDWIDVQSFPDFKMLLGEESPARLVSPPRAIRRPDYDSLTDDYFTQWFLDVGAVFPVLVDDSEDHLRALLNLSSLLLDSEGSPEGLESDGWTCTSDRGLIDTSFGNAGYSSHAYAGLYRGMLLQHPSQGSALPHLRTWCQDSGATMLALGLHHLDGRRHHAVQLNLSRALEFDVEEGVVSVFHDGRMSKGGGGSFKRAETIAQLRKSAPDLVRGNRAWLGDLPTTELITWEAAFPMFVRLLRFALATDTLRTR